MMEYWKKDSTTKNYGFRRLYPEKGYTLEQYEKAEEHWKKLLRDLEVKTARLPAQSYCNGSLVRKFERQKLEVR